MLLIHTVCLRYLSRSLLLVQFLRKGTADEGPMSYLKRKDRVTPVAARPAAQLLFLPGDPPTIGSFLQCRCGSASTSKLQHLNLLLAGHGRESSSVSPDFGRQSYASCYQSFRSSMPSPNSQRGAPEPGSTSCMVPAQDFILQEQHRSRDAGKLLRPAEE